MGIPPKASGGFEADPTMEFKSSGVRDVSRIQRRRFCAAEDQLLEHLVQQFGTSSWDQIAVLLPDRSARQCRERWNHYLSAKQPPPWTETEDNLLWGKIADLGPKWSQVAACFEGRTDFQIKARWMFLFRTNQRRLFRSACTETTAKDDGSDHRQDGESKNDAPCVKSSEDDPKSNGWSIENIFQCSEEIESDLHNFFLFF
jgi:hypothetical protein